MKEIYIRQLSAHAAGVARADEQAATLTHMQAKVRDWVIQYTRLGVQLDAITIERDSLIAQVSQMRGEFNEYKQQHDNTVQQLKVQLIYATNEVSSAGT
jgi:uncharacterized coiled-coil DUF342 family protein